MTPDLHRRREQALTQEIDDLRSQVAHLRKQIEAGPVIIAQPTIRRLVQAAAAEFGITPMQLLSYRRARAYVVPRHVVMHIAIVRMGHSLARVGRVLGRDHSTVFHGLHVMAARVAADPAFAARVERVAQAAIPATPEEITDADAG